MALIVKVKPFAGNESVNKPQPHSVQNSLRLHDDTS